jgi:hypothetical protein
MPTSPQPKNNNPVSTAPAPNGAVLNKNLTDIVVINPKQTPCFGVEDCKNHPTYAPTQKSLSPSPAKQAATCVGVENCKLSNKPATTPSDGAKLNKNLTDPNSIVSMKPITQSKKIMSAPPQVKNPIPESTFNSTYDPAESILNGTAPVASPPPQYRPTPQVTTRGNPQQCQQAMSAILNGSDPGQATQLGNWYNANCL